MTVSVKFHMNKILTNHIFGTFFFINSLYQGVRENGITSVYILNLHLAESSLGIHKWGAGIVMKDSQIKPARTSALKYVILKFVI